jgi:lipoprotein-anchoring transpeptidase ErfK/SrfK
MRLSACFAAGVFVAGIVGGFSAASAASLEARVSIPDQTMTVTRYGKVLHTWKVSTARSGYKTPSGEWRPYRMHVMWRSIKYDNAPMPYAVFYDGGYAIHGTTAVSRLGSPASHGCVRLLTENAHTFYNLVREVGPGNTRVIVSNEPLPAVATASASSSIVSLGEASN